MNKRFEKNFKNLIWNIKKKISLVDDRLKKTPKGYLSIEKRESIQAIFICNMMKIIS